MWWGMVVVVGFFLEREVLKSVKSEAFVKDPAWCFLPKLVLFALLTLAEIIVHLITLSHVIHLSSRKLRLGNLTFLSGTEGGKGGWVLLKKANNPQAVFFFFGGLFVGFFLLWGRLVLFGFGFFSFRNT